MTVAPPKGTVCREDEAMRPGWNPTKRNRNIGTKKQGHGRDNRLVIPQAWPEDRIFWEVLRSPVLVTRQFRRHERIRFGTCKRASTRLVSHLADHDQHIERFLAGLPRYRDWTIERVAIAPRIESGLRREIKDRGYRAQDLTDLLAGL